MYTCLVKVDTYITTSDSVDILTAKGTHINGSNHNSVQAIKADNSRFSYFPHGLKRIFKKLKLIWIETCQMKEIHQTDLMLYPDLEGLYVCGNDIQVLDEDLFNYNPSLKVFSCWYCNIFHVDSKVFDNLSKLFDVWLVVNECIDKKSDGNPTSLSETIAGIKQKCVSPKFLILKEKFDDFEKRYKKWSYEKYHENLELLEIEFKNSKFSHFPSLKKKINEFKDHVVPNLCSLKFGNFKGDGITALNMKINDIESDLKISIIDATREMGNLVMKLQDKLSDTLVKIFDEKVSKCVQA